MLFRSRELGIPKLKQEKSLNYAAGITFTKKAFSATIDFYHVTIEDRIVLTGTFYDDDPEIGADLQALNVSAAQFFTNAVNTSTDGIDAVLTYNIMIKDKHKFNFSLAGNFNKMKIDKIYTNDKLSGKEVIYFGVREQYFLLASAPSSKVSFGINYSINHFFADLRFTQFGEVKLVNFNDNGDDVVTESSDPYTNELDLYKPKFTTDLALGYNFKNVSLTVGATNLLNQYPDPHDPGLTESGGTWDAVQMGFAGSFYYAKLGFKF